MRLRATLVTFALSLSAACAMAIATNAAGTPTVKTRQGAPGTYVVDARGLSLYLFARDRSKRSTCYGACAQVWKPLTVKGTPRAGPGLKASLLSTTTRTTGRTQVTYGGHQLYHYDDDAKAGQTRGHGIKAFGARWYLVAPSGKKIGAASGPTTPPPPPPYPY